MTHETRVKNEVSQTSDGKSLPDKKWMCSLFSVTLPSGQLPELLRRVANSVEGISPKMVFDVVVRDDGEEVTATVYYISKNES